jgi:2-iminoacetate synthase ThiH
MRSAKVQVQQMVLMSVLKSKAHRILEENVVTAAGKEYKPAKVEEIIKAVKSVGRPVAQRDTGYEVLRFRCVG